MEDKKWKPYNTKAIINNLRLVFKSKDIIKLNKPTYDFLNQLSGFIAHYDLYGFRDYYSIDYYSDLRTLINDLAKCSDVLNPDYWLQDDFMKEQAEYYKSKAETLKQIKTLIEEFKVEIENSFAEKEKLQDMCVIKHLMIKHNLKEVKA